MSLLTTEKFIFTWEVENFNLCLLKAGEVLSSPVFETDIFKESSWFLEIHNKISEKYMSCYITRTKFKEDISLKFGIKLIHNESEGLEILGKDNDICTFTEDDDSYGYEKFYEIDKLENIAGSITIRCVMAPPKSAQKTFRCKGRTKITVDRSCFRWNVEGMNSSSWKTSKIFPCSSSADLQLELTAPEDFIIINIKTIDKGNSALYYVSCKLTLLNLKGVERDSKKSEHLFKSDEDNNRWQFPNFLQKSKLQNDEKNFIKEGKFTIMCEFCVSDGSSVDFIEEFANNGLVNIYSGTKEDSLNVLQENLLQMYTKRLQTDVELRTGTRTFQAHKSCLSARSPVFGVMFEQEMLEKHTGVVDIPDVETKVLESFLEFIYAGTVNILDHELASKLLIVADKYQVSSLKKKCSSFLMLNLSTANAFSVVGVANMIGDRALKSFAMDYIAAYANVIFISEDWSQCIQNDIKLATDILNNLSINVDIKSK